MKKSKILIGARRLIWNGSCEYICHAMDEVVHGKSLKTRRRAEELRECMTQVVEDQATLSGFLREQFGIEQDVANEVIFQRCLRDLRILWLNAMISGLKENGQ